MLVPCKVCFRTVGLRVQRSNLSIAQEQQRSDQASEESLSPVAHRVHLQPILQSRSAVLLLKIYLSFRFVALHTLKNAESRLLF